MLASRVCSTGELLIGLPYLLLLFLHSDCMGRRELLSVMWLGQREMLLMLRFIPKANHFV